MEVFSLFGVPKKLQSDCEKSFNSNLLMNMLDKLKVLKITANAYSHKEMGKVESQVKVVKTTLQKIMTDIGENWLKALPLCNAAVNMSIKELTGLSPQILMFNRHNGVFEGGEIPDVITEDSEEARAAIDKWLKHQALIMEELFPATRERIKAMKERQNEIFNKKHITVDDPLEVGTKVILRELKNMNKNTPHFHSVMKIIKVNDDLSYDLEDGAKIVVKNRTIDQLKVLPIGAEFMEDTFLVEKILDNKKINGQMYYKVKFLGYDAEADWEPCHNISDELIKTYWAKKQVPKEPKPDKETRLKRKLDKTDILEKTKEKNTKKSKKNKTKDKTQIGNAYAKTYNSHRSGT